MAVSSGRLSNILHECFSNVWAFAMKPGGQGPTEWTAWVQTLHIPKPVIMFAFKVLQQRLLHSQVVSVEDSLSTHVDSHIHPRVQWFFS